jgi:hypothetical protein
MEEIEPPWCLNIPTCGNMFEMWDQQTYCKKSEICTLHHPTKNQIVRCFMIWILFLIWVINYRSVQYAQRLAEWVRLTMYPTPSTGWSWFYLFKSYSCKLYSHLTHIHTWIDISIPLYP